MIYTSAIYRPQPSFWQRYWPRLAGLATLMMVVGLVAVVTAKTVVGWSSARFIFQRAKPAPAFEPAAVEQQFQAIANHYPTIKTSVVFTDVGTDTTASIQATHSFRAASTTKLLAAAYYLHLVEHGSRTMTQLLGPYSAQQQLQLLINQSNNDSWAIFLQNLGLSQQQAYARGLGLSSFDVSTNSIDAMDMNQFLVLLAQGKLLNDQNRQLLLSWMQQTYEEDLIPPAIPDSMEIYHKSGTLEDDIHDVGLIQFGSRWYTLTIYTNGNGSQDYTVREALIQQLTKVAVATIEEAGKN